MQVDAGDQLEGESFQPAYAPYVPPPQAYDGAYEPLEQRGIEAAVAAGAAGYNGVSMWLNLFFLVGGRGGSFLGDFFNWLYSQCWGSGSEGFSCFWASRIRVRIH